MSIEVVIHPLPYTPYTPNHFMEKFVRVKNIFLTLLTSAEIANLNTFQNWISFIIEAKITLLLYRCCLEFDEYSSGLSVNMRKRCIIISINWKNSVPTSLWAISWSNACLTNFVVFLLVIMSIDWRLLKNSRKVVIEICCQKWIFRKKSLKTKRNNGKIIFNCD